MDKKHAITHCFGNGLRPQIWNDFAERFNIKNIRELYGSSEGNCGFMNITGQVGAVGFAPLIAKRLYPVALLKVEEDTDKLTRDENGMCIRCKPGEPGHLVGKIIKGDPFRSFDGYLSKDATDEKTVHDVFKKGDMGYLSGDILVMDGYGFMYFCDRTGDTFRWKGENVSTTEVEATISNSIELHDAVAYGVAIPGTDGKAGMAAIVDSHDKVDVAQLYADMKKSLPTYAIPVFIRLLQSEQAELTSTFKLQKTQYRRDGYDPSRVCRDKLFYLDSKAGEYKPLDGAVYKDIQNEEIRF